ncbi:class I SAM-dependent methyltransferase [Edaphobacter albus]|uniref:class I SAM-dependent methyltransferase n=1 Tax=Edaphobacter sp. 4G125 TaxID=2763071 RepID=UPI001646745F|nr:class I SAM-dependent methyltransferase [Edaphobacter sp. 4G125]QNI36103.1 class I SAM-dependent methyltransferase [Edaphobacter sp. 4G125]
MANLTQQVFNATASTYDADRSRLIPGCDRFYGWAIDLIPVNAKNILELGAGSGLYTQLIRDRFPKANIHLMDFSGSMLALAQNRLGNDPLITYSQADYLTEPFPHQLCAVVSSLSIHHLEDDGKRAIFRKAYSALLPNGVFINAEQVAGPTPELETRYKDLWLEQVRAAGATEQQIIDSLYRQQEDRCATVENQLLWMREAGFADADCWYKENRFAVFSGTRP